MATVTTDLVGAKPTIAVDRAGDGPLVVFLHGIGGNRTNWQDQLPVFASHYTALAWDARGYGLSDDYEGPLRFDDFADDLHRVLDHYGARRAHLVGLSMGGRIAMRFFFLHPERVATLTLADTHRGFGSLTPEKRAEFVRTRREPLQAGGEPRDIASVVAKTLIGPTSPPSALQRLVDSIGALHKDSYLKSIEATVNQDLVGDFRTITAPTHVVVGQYDTLTPPELARSIAADIAGAELTVIPDAGHLSNIENPGPFNAAVLAFLARHPTADRPAR